MSWQRDIKKITREVSEVAGYLSDLNHFQNTGGLSGILLRIRDSIREIERTPSLEPGSFERADVRDELHRIAALSVSGILFLDNELEIPENTPANTPYLEEYGKLFNLVADVFAKGDRESLGVLNEYYKSRLQNEAEEEAHGEK